MRHFSFAGPMNMEHRSNSPQPLQTCQFKNFAIRSMRGKRIFIDGLACRSIISVDRPHRKTMRTQHFYRRLDAAGLIEERDVQQVWSPRDGKFLDRYVIGTCPHCGSQDARGDQCEACGRLLDPPDLIQPRSAISGDTLLELRWSRHLFLRQPLLVERLRAWLGTIDGWPPFVLFRLPGAG